jgi:K+-sensing histidine kinase KdpD
LEKSNGILVCVTQQKTCERLIRKAATLRNDLRGKLFVLHVARSDWNFLDSKSEGEALEYLFDISKSVNAELSVLKSDDIIKAIIDFVAENKISLIIIGKAVEFHQENNFFRELSHQLPAVEIKVLPPEFPGN